MKRRKFLLIIVVIAIGIISLILINNKFNSKTSLTSSSTITKSNKKIGWGIKRADNNKQPDLGNENKNLLEVYERNSYGK